MVQLRLQFFSQEMGCTEFSVSVHMVQLQQQYCNWHHNEWILYAFLAIATAMQQ